jgi:hypothetical protein
MPRFSAGRGSSCSGPGDVHGRRGPTGRNRTAPERPHLRSGTRAWSRTVGQSIRSSRGPAAWRRPLHRVPRFPYSATPRSWQCMESGGNLWGLPSIIACINEPPIARRFLAKSLPERFGSDARSGAIHGPDREPGLAGVGLDFLGRDGAAPRGRSGSRSGRSSGWRISAWRC